MASHTFATHPIPSPTVLLCGGGTGGHVYPALAVADALRDAMQAASGGLPQARAQPGGFSGPTGASAPSIIYVGSTDGMEAGLVREESALPFRAIAAAPVRGRNPLALGRNVLTLGRGAVQARRLIAELRPAAILGTGGYVCAPLFVAARMAGVPTAIYLPDVVPGLAVRTLARLATVVACNVEDSARYFGVSIGDVGLPTGSAEGNQKSKIHNRKSKILVTGYPVRGELFAQDNAACRAAFGLDATSPVLLVYGGSRGARSINTALAALLPQLLPLAQIIHVCGREGDEGFLRAAAARLPGELQKRYMLYPYLFGGADKAASAHHVTPSMTRAFGAADLAICRSGASTMAELPAAALPAVLVPYPYVHQEENADYLVARGAALKIGDADMLGSGRPEHGRLFQAVRRLLLDHEERLHMAACSRMLARPHAARQLAALLLALATSTRTER